jgi:hypothetical protein
MGWDHKKVETSNWKTKTPTDRSKTMKNRGWSLEQAECTRNRIEPKGNTQHWQDKQHWQGDCHHPTPMPEDAEIQPSDARAMMRPREQIAPVTLFITPPLVAPRSRRRRSRHRHSQPFTPPPLAPPPLTLRSRRCRAFRLAHADSRQRAMWQGGGGRAAAAACRKEEQQHE